MKNLPLLAAMERLQNMERVWIPQKEMMMAWPSLGFNQGEDESLHLTSIFTQNFKSEPLTKEFLKAGNPPSVHFWHSAPVVQDDFTYLMTMVSGIKTSFFQNVP